jgi:hypothetical protein
MAVNAAGLFVNVWRDMQQAFDYATPDRSNTVPLRYWYSLHTDLLSAWVKVRHLSRKVFRTSDNIKTVSHRAGADIRISQLHKLTRAGKCGSGLLAIDAAFALNFDAVVLAGLPFDNGPHVFDHPKTECAYVTGIHGLQYLFTHEWQHRTIVALSGSLINSGLVKHYE